MIDPTAMLIAIAQISATIITITFAVFAIFLQRDGSNHTGYMELRSFIKFDFARASIVTVAFPVLFIQIFSILREYFSIQWINEVEYVIVFAFWVLMVLFMWRIINRVYYATLQHEEPVFDTEGMRTTDDIGMIQFDTKRYNAGILKRKIFPKVFKRCKDEMKEHKDANQIFNDYVDKTIVLQEYHEDPCKVYAKKEKKPKLMLRPRVQSPDGVIMICLDRLAETDWREDAVEYSLKILYEFYRYSEKQQDESKLGNRILGRTKYACPTDSTALTLYANILVRRSDPLDPDEKTRLLKNAVKLYDKAILKDVNNNMAVNNRSVALSLISQIHIQSENI